jgi:dihydropteroate synthase
VALAPLVMGIVNVTPDSFFAQSRSATATDAIERGRALFAAGCDVVDVGGESTRPGAAPVGPDDEIARVQAVVEALAKLGPVSVDTQKEVVARRAVDAGALIINDVSCSLIEVAGELGVGYVAMHRQGDSRSMQIKPWYDDVVNEVGSFLRVAAEKARDHGVKPLWLDPGIGFGKTLAHNLSLLGAVRHFVELAREYDAGVLIGTSRKSFLGQLSSVALEVDQRLEGSVASEAWVMLEGVSMVRVHDAAAAVQLRELLVRPVEEVVS